MSEVLEAVVGEYGFGWEFTVKDAQGAAKDLTDYTVTLKAWIPGEALLEINGMCTKTDPTIGKCTYIPEAADVDTKGNYRALLELQKAGELLKTKPFAITIEEGSPP